MRKKIILILALFGDPTLPAGVSHTGGFNQTLRELLTSLAAFPIPICVITDTSQYCTDNSVRISNNINLYRVPVSKSEHEDQENLRTAQNRILRDISIILGDGIADIALIHSFYWFSGHLAKCLNEVYRIPYIHTPISLSYNKIAAGCNANCGFQVECEPAFLQGADCILAITEQEASILTSHYHIQRARIIITGRSVDMIFHNPVRDNKGFPRGIIQDRILRYNESNAMWWNSGAFTYLGRIVPIKGILEIIQSWAALRKRYGSFTPPLWIVGGSPSQIAIFRKEAIARLKNMAEYEAQQGIVWWGYLDQASISALFLKTLVLVTHSRFEAGGRVILEAMCQGKPVIATPNGFAADYIQEGINGFLVSYGDTVRLERCMEYFIRQPYLSCSMGNAAKLTFEQIEYNWNYTGIHKTIYEHYLTGKTVLLEHVSPAIPQLTNEQLEKVDCFPYLDISFTKAEWIKDISPNFPHPIQAFDLIELTDAHARHYRCRSGGISYRIKQFYSRLNENALWNSREQVKVLGGTEQLYRADMSQQFSEVVPIMFFSGQGNYYVLPEFEPINLDYDSLFSLLLAFSTSNNPNASTPSGKQMWELNDVHDFVSHPDTLEEAINLLALSSIELGSSISKEVLPYRAQIDELLNRTHSSACFGLNYGKSPVHHIVTQNGRAMLLPTADWYWGELGIDFAIASLQMGKEAYALPGQKDNTRQQLWLVYLTWKKILLTEWNGKTSEPFWIRLLSSTLSELGITNELLKL